MQPDEHNTIKKYISYFVNIISLISGIITILSFYGYTNTRHLTFIILGIMFIILTIFIFVNRERISQRLELKYRKFNKQVYKNLKKQVKLNEKNVKLTKDFYNTYDAKSVIELLDYISCNGGFHDQEIVHRIKTNFENRNLSAEDVYLFNEFYHQYKNRLKKDTD